MPYPGNGERLPFPRIPPIDRVHLGMGLCGQSRPAQRGEHEWLTK